MGESIIKSSLRTFFVVLSGLLGLFFAFILISLVLSSTMDTMEGDAQISYQYDAKVVPNGKNVRKVIASTYPTVLKINIHGEIGTEALNKNTIANLLVESRERAFEKDRVKAIILNINTPGGTVVDANAIYQALKSYKEEYKTPIYAYVDGLCASGGMYVACAADKIYASDASVVGSVGVILGPFMNYYKLMEKVGVASETLTAGKGKDEMNPLRPWTADESESFKKMTDFFYDHFVDIVIANRPKMDKQKLVDEYGARVFPAKTAEEYGYIDGSNHSFNQALTMLVKEIGIDDDMYQVVEFESNNWLASLIKGKVNLGLLSGEVKHRLDLPFHLNPAFSNKPLYLYNPDI